MATQVQLRRGTSTQNDSFTGAQGELTFDTTNKRVRIHDGATAGGFELKTENAGGDTLFGDNEKAIFGAGSDLQIYHDGSDSFVSDTGTGDLYLQGSSNIYFRKGNGSEVFAHFTDDGACKLRFDNSTKIATTSTGIDVTGTAVTDGLTVDAGGISQLSNVSRIGDNSSFADLTLNSSDSSQGTINFADASDANIGRIQYNHTDNTMILRAADATRVTVSSTGIDVTGTVTADGIINDSTQWIKFDNANTFISSATLGLLIQTPPSNNNTIFRNNTGVERMRIDSSGYVGIGTSSPTLPLDIVSNAGADALKIRARPNGNDYGTLTFYNNAGTTKWADIQSNVAKDLRFYTNGGTEAMRIDSSGHLMGKVPDVKIGADTGAVVFGTVSANSTKFITNDTERMRIDSSGTVLVGKTSEGTDTDGIELNRNDVIVATRNNDAPLILNRRTSDGDITAFRKDNAAVGSIGADAGFLTIGDASCRLLFLDTFPAIIPRGATNVGSDGAIALGDSGSRFKDLYLSGGVFLGGTGSANKLEDYEEGSYIADFATQNGSITLLGTQNTMNYTKIGRQVTITGRVVVNSVSSASGWVRFSLPFTNVGESEDEGHSILNVATYNVNGIGTGQVFAEIGPSTSYGILLKTLDNTGWAYLDASGFGSNDIIYMNGTYLTSS